MFRKPVHYFINTRYVDYNNLLIIIKFVITCINVYDILS